MSTVIRSLLIVVLAVAAVLTYSATFIVDEREKVMVLRFGEIRRTIESPGLYFKLPIIEDLVVLEDRLLFFESTDKRVQVVDSRRYLVDTITMFRITDPKRFRESVGADLRRVRRRIETRLEAALRSTYGKRTFEAALSKERAEMMREIRDALRPQGRQLGIEIVDVRIRRTDLLPDVLKSTYERMSAERLAEAEQIRAVGNERSLTIRAQADRQAVVLVSEARRDSEIIRGQGDAERNRIFAEAFTKDPEFFAFYRSMQAYAKSLSDSNTTLVLKPDSEFFQFFGKAGAGDKPAPKPPAQ
ncbi:MAG: protease modulator HflC [Gammaproteobacteria bacterium]|nr:protease modulator HflC [Gammaproteobacteria bacterium]